MSPNITTSHLSPGAVEAIVEPFQDFATIIRKLQTLADRICSASPKLHGKVIQTFASATQQELIEFKKYMASIQRCYHRQFTGRGITIKGDISQSQHRFYILAVSSLI
jgi:hypothetical protein